MTWWRRRLERRRRTSQSRRNSWMKFNEFFKAMRQTQNDKLLFSKQYLQNIHTRRVCIVKSKKVRKGVMSEVEVKRVCGWVSWIKTI